MYICMHLKCHPCHSIHHIYLCCCCSSLAPPQPLSPSSANLIHVEMFRTRAENQNKTFYVSFAMKFAIGVSLFCYFYTRISMFALLSVLVSVSLTISTQNRFPIYIHRAARRHPSMGILDVSSIFTRHVGPIGQSAGLASVSGCQFLLYMCVSVCVCLLGSVFAIFISCPGKQTNTHTTSTMNI